MAKTEVKPLKDGSRIIFDPDLRAEVSAASQAMSEDGVGKDTTNVGIQEKRNFCQSMIYFLYLLRTLGADLADLNPNNCYGEERTDGSIQKKMIPDERLKRLSHQDFETYLAQVKGRIPSDLLNNEKIHSRLGALEEQLQSILDS